MRLPSSAVVVGLGLVMGAASVRADSVAQVATSKFITDETLDALECRADNIDGTDDCNECTSADDEFCVGSGAGGIDAGAGGGGTGGAIIRVGDILTFRITFTPVPNGRFFGGGGYITEYVPPGTEVVGVRMVDRVGNTVRPRRAGPMASGWGSRGDKSWDDLGFTEGSITQTYCDTGIFFSTDARTAQAPADQLLTVDNGLLMAEAPTGVGMFNELIGAINGYHAHNAWDLDQVYAFGTSQAHNGGTGSTPHRYGSAVAGPATWYGLEASPGVAVLDPLLVGTTGPWQRIRVPGSETCTGDPSTAVGTSLRVGVPTDAGRDVSPTNPLPVGTNAVRYAVGELMVGQEYFAEVSLRVVTVPMHPTLGNVNCAEVFGGDASFPEVASGSSGKDNPWRYFLPAPTCTNVDVFFGKSVDKPLALRGDTLTYTIRIINLSREAQTNVVITDLIDTENGARYVSATGDATIGAPTLTGSLLTWPTIASLAPGEEHELTVVVEAGDTVTINQAYYDSTQIQGYRAVAFTLTEPVAVITQAKTVAPRSVTAGDSVRYTITVRNDGTEAASGGVLHEELAAGWVVTPGTTTLDGVAFADPAPLAVGVAWTGLPAVAPGAAFALAFDVVVPLGTTTGVYGNTFLTAFGEIETKTFETARLGVGIVFSEPPVVAGPLEAGETEVRGTSSEGDGATIRLRVNGVELATTTTLGGVWIVTGLPNLFAGQYVTATAQAPGEAESDESSPVVVTASGSGPGGGGGDGGFGGSPDAGGHDGGGAAGDGDGGCGCRVAAGAPPRLSLLLGSLVGLAFLVRRRRARRRALLDAPRTGH